MDLLRSRKVAYPWTGETHFEVAPDAQSNLRVCSGLLQGKLQLTAIWTPKTLTLSCGNKSGIAHGLMQCPIKGDTPYFTTVQFWMLHRALQFQRGSKEVSTPVLEAALPHCHRRRTRSMYGSQGCGSRAQDSSRYDKMQLTSFEFLCCQDCVRTRTTTDITVPP